MTLTKLLLIVCIVISFRSLGQTNTDIQSRVIPSLEFKLNKKWKFASEYRYSLENDLEKFRSSSIQLESKYSITKNLSLSGGYRFTTSFKEDSHRFFGAIEYDYTINKIFIVSSTTKYQYSTNSFDSNFINEYKKPIKIARQKIKIEFNVPRSKVSFNAGAEIFLKTESQPFFKFNRMRYELGTNYNLKKYGKLGFSVFYEDKYNQINSF